jgi:7,8-dihydropterin-6-yl-methyl-4-(beta-D-ribofuranosyl)aminobenzene 5'-phosphate synthase
MKEFGVEQMIGAHCTGINAVTLLRESCSLTRETAFVGAVGTTFTLSEGAQPGRVNR